MTDSTTTAKTATETSIAKYLAAGVTTYHIDLPATDARHDAYEQIRATTGFSPADAWSPDVVALRFAASLLRLSMLDGNPKVIEVLEPEIRDLLDLIDELTAHGGAAQCASPQRGRLALTKFAELVVQLWT